MKVLIVTSYFLPHIGGVENYVYNIGKGLGEKYGWEVVVVTSNYEENKYEEEIIGGIRVIRLPSWFTISSTPINPLWLFNIHRIIRNERPDVINVHSPVPYIADITSLVAGKTPFITTYHSGSMIKEKSALNPLIFLYESLLLKLLFRRSTKIICVSPDYIKRNLKEYVTKVKYISPGVDTSLFKPSKRKATNDVLFVGRIERNSDWKGIKYLLEAISIIKQTKPKISLRLVGSGDRIEYFKKYSRKLEIKNNIKFVGARTGKTLVREYQNSNVIVLPSVTESESFGIVLIEAMACKKPVIGSEIGGITYVIDNNKTGLLLSPRNSKELAKAIIRILENPKLAKNMAENGYRKVKENFTWDKKAKKTNEIMLEVLKK